MLRGRLAIQYIFKEMIPILLVGVFIFVLILLMFQALRLTEFVLVHGVSLATVGKMMGYMAISFLPAILPMSLLFAVLLTYGRLSSDSEIVAMKAIGLNLKHLSTPAIALGLLIAILSAKVSFQLAPWGNRQFELLIAQLGQSKASVSIKEGVFSEGFFDLVVYANKVDSKKGLLNDVFIYDERDPELPLTIIAREGRMVQDESNTAKMASIRLIDGNIHRTSTESNTKIDFMIYDLNLMNPIKRAFKEKSTLSLTHDDILEKIAKLPPDSRDWRKMKIEYHKRWGLAVGCILFALLGVGLGTTTNRRNAKSGGMVACLGIIVTYWVSYVTLENLGMKGSLPPIIATWMTNVVFLGFAIWALRRARN